MSKEDLKEIKRRENNGDLSELMTSESGKVHRLKKCIIYLKVKGDFPPEARELRHDTIKLDDWEDFIRDPNVTKMLESTGDVPFNSPPALHGSSESSSHQLTHVESFERSIQLCSSQLTNFKEGKCCDSWRRNF